MAAALNTGFVVKENASELAATRGRATVDNGIRKTSGDPNALHTLRIHNDDLRNAQRLRLCNHGAPHADENNPTYDEDEKDGDESAPALNAAETCVEVTVHGILLVAKPVTFCANNTVSGIVANGCDDAYDIAMDLQFTAVFRKVAEGYIGFVEELPGANTQGATLEEARANLQEAVEMVLQANRELIEEAAAGGEVIREPFKVIA